MAKEERGFTTLELIAVTVVIVVGAAAAYIYSRPQAVNTKAVPRATVPPKTLIISRKNAGGFTVKVDNTVAANKIISDIKSLPLANPKTHCTSEAGPTYSLTFTDPDSAYVANYYGCFDVRSSNTNQTLKAMPSDAAGKTFWTDVQKLIGRPLS